MRSRCAFLLACALAAGHPTRTEAAPPSVKPALMRSTESKARNRAAKIRRTVRCTLAVQNACQMRSMRYSRLPSQPKYLSSTAVVSAEVVKIVLSFVALVAQQGMPAARLVWESVFAGAGGESACKITLL